MTATDKTSAFDALGELLGERFTTARAVRDEHGKDASWHPPQPPDAVCFPESTAEVARVVAICAGERIPMIPFGTGTSLEGHVQAPHGGVSVDLSRMDRIVALRPADLDATVEAGVTCKQLNRLAADHGLFFPVDPGAECTLGGMAATRASGTNAVRYGTMRENVLAMTVVLPDGRVIRTGSRARKSSAGYDLTRLFVGSEGTLGIATEVTLRLHGLPEAISSAAVSFASLHGAVHTAIRTIQSGIPVARMELLDALLMDAVNRYARLDHAVAPTLLFEFHGSAAGVEEQARDVAQIAAELGGEGFRWSVDAAQRERLWEARHHAYFAALALRPGCQGWTTDVCVPISRLADCVLETRQDLEESPLLAPIVGHVGDGNFHLVMLVDRDDPADLAEAQRIHERLVARALAMDGTSTGEHGVGLGKRAFMAAEHGDALDVMRAVKAAIDPLGLMNPGKIL
ncbi:MAG TPA: FAD-linked oxidase C-terminal domain-containing protein [Thermoanaerobaculia bacterium]